jgi:hypothetical protein
MYTNADGLPECIGSNDSVLVAQRSPLLSQLPKYVKITFSRMLAPSHV